MCCYLTIIFLQQWKGYGGQDPGYSSTVYVLFLDGSLPEYKAPPVAGVHGAPGRPQLEGRPRRFHRQIHIGATRTY